MIVAGDAVIDLTGYWDGQTGTPAGASSIDIVVGLGGLTVILPGEEFVHRRLDRRLGKLRKLDGDFGQASCDDLTVEFGPDGETVGPTDRWLTLDIIVGAGDLTITTEGDRC